MDKMKHYQGAALRLLKALLAAYIVTGLLLLLLALLLYKLRLSEAVINLGITAIYLLACFLTGFLLGKMMKTRKYHLGRGRRPPVFRPAGPYLPGRPPGLLRNALQPPDYTAALHGRRHLGRHAVLSCEKTAMLHLHTALPLFPINCFHYWQLLFYTNKSSFFSNVPDFLFRHHFDRHR